MNFKSHILTLVLCLGALCDGRSQSTVLTYQGRLNTAGSPANGIYDLRFGLYPGSSGGAQVGNLITNPAVTISNGLFTVPLDFGNVFNAASMWLEIGVRTNVSSS
ncbi:MAG TPA: hypothetical protein VH255_02745, partial [Verrucomicrobiae bacterium]|nr:hypothetical protein [Verrucomicrobiae bacterium]